MPNKRGPVTGQPTVIPAAVKPQNPHAGSKFARGLYANVNARLEQLMETFAENAGLEEKRLMSELLRDWEGRSCSGRPQSPGDHEIPLYSAIQRQMDHWDSVCLVLGDSDLVEPVEEFILALQKKRWKKTPWTSSDSDAEIRSRFEKGFRSETEVFARDAGLPSLRLMSDILARWNELHRDPEIKALPNILAVAAEMELDTLRINNAAEAAEKGKVAAA